MPNGVIGLLQVGFFALSSLAQARLLVLLKAAGESGGRTLVPTTGTVGLPVVIFTGGASLVIRYEFIRRKNSGLTYTPQQSSTLTAGSWQAMTGTTTVTLMNATWERVVIEPPWQTGSRLLRVQVVME